MKAMYVSLRVLLIVVVAAAAGPAAAQKMPGHELGFKPDRLYQFTDLDSVNLFNGNLTVSIPIGQRYSVGGNLGYQFQLVYNSKMWDYMEWIDDNYESILAEPNIRSNAGVGWRLSLGRLLSPSDTTMMMYPSETAKYVYESPYGDEHAFSSLLNTETGTYNEDAIVLFATEARLRMVKVSSTSRYIEFPNGEKHTFKYENNSWRLEWQEDRFGNWVKVTYEYDTEKRDTKWTISDSAGRIHTAVFINKAALSDSYSKGQIVDTVTLASFGGASAVYDFTYEDKDVAYGCSHNSGGRPPEAPDTVTTKRMPLLMSVDPPGDTGTFSFAYEISATDNCDQGALKRLTVPTGGWVDYKYQQYYLPTNQCADIAWADQPVGIFSKTTSQGHVWDYVHSTGKPLAGQEEGLCGTNPDNGEPILTQPPVRWARTTVLAPATEVTDPETLTPVLRRTRTDHYFDIWVGGADDPLLDVSPDGGSYGLQGVGGAPAATDDQAGVKEGSSTLVDIDVRRTFDGKTQVLTSRTFEHCSIGRSGNCSTATTPVPGRFLRSNYQRWAPGSGSTEADRMEELLGSRMITSSSTIHEADSGCSGACVTSVINDHLKRNKAGQDRRSTFTSNFPGAADVATLTEYPVWTKEELRATASTSKKWLFDTYTEKRRTVGTSYERTLYCFNVDGFLQRARTLAGTSPGDTDTLRVFTATTGGEVDTESTYGGDDIDGTGAQKLGTAADICTATLPTSPLSKADYDYTAGILTKAAYSSPAVTTLERTVDLKSGLVTADYDSAGVATTYTYDGLTGRLTQIDPPGGAVVALTYTSSPATVAIVTSDAAATAVQKEHVAFDAFGRPTRESRWFPAATSSDAKDRWVTTETLYDGLGRKRAVSVPTATTGTAPPTAPFLSPVATTYEYDESGRTVRLVAPDGSVARTIWTSSRAAQRLSSLHTTVGAREIEVQESYDGEGKLLSVTEGSGAPTTNAPYGTAVTTSYQYDTGGRLKSVKVGGEQPRTFTYDGRGYLTSETHPENGTTSYVYDGRGHARSATRGGRTLSFTFDGAERLTEIKEGTAVLKEFTFGVENVATNLVKGKLETARRRNVLESSGTIDVVETYTYDSKPLDRPANPAGRMSQRTTTVNHVVGETVSELQKFVYAVDYDVLGMPEKLVMPKCSLNGCSSTSGLTSVDTTRSGGLLTGVTGFGALTYHPSGMVEKVTHSSTATAAPADTYSAVNGLARPSAIKFSGGGCPTPTGSVISTASAVCASSSGNTASVEARPNVIHSWSISAGTITSSITGDAITFTAPASGPFTLTVTATDSCGGTASSSESISVSPAPAAPVISVESPLCSGGGRTAWVDAVAGLTYSWSVTGGTITSSTSGAQITFTAPDSGSVTLHVVADGACGATESEPKTVTPVASPTAKLQSALPRITRGESVTMQVSLTGASPRTIVWSDGYQQSNITTDTVSRTVSPTVTTEYSLSSVTAGSCSGTVSGYVNVTVLLPPPASVAATTQTNRSVSISWSAVTGATAYRVERTGRVGAAAAWSVITTATSYADVVPESSAAVTYIYYVRAIDASDEVSNRGAWDYATAATLLYQRSLIEAQKSTMFAGDLMELRAGADALRAAAGVASAFGAAASLQGAMIRAVDVTDIVTAMNGGRSAMALSPFAYTGVAAPAAGGSPLAAHVLQLREALR